MADVGKVLVQRATDVVIDSPAASRYLGLLRNNFTRLNLASSLDNAADRADFYNFRVAGAGNIGLGIVNSANVRIQMFERGNNRLVADNSAAEGTPARDNFANLMAGKFEVTRQRDYVLKVTRGNGVGTSEKADYVLQLTMGDKFKFDYETVERPVPRDVLNVPPATTYLTSVLDNAGELRRSRRISFFA